MLLPGEGVRSKFDVVRARKMEDLADSGLESQRVETASDANFRLPRNATEPFFEESEQVFLPGGDNPFDSSLVAAFVKDRLVG